MWLVKPCVMMMTLLNSCLYSRSLKGGILNASQCPVISRMEDAFSSTCLSIQVPVLFLLPLPTTQTHILIMETGFSALLFCSNKIACERSRASSQSTRKDCVIAE